MTKTIYDATFVGGQDVGKYPVGQMKFELGLIKGFQPDSDIYLRSLDCCWYNGLTQGSPG